MATIPSIAMIPSGVKAGKLYSVLPTNGAGDFTTTRASVATRVNENGLIEEVAANVPRLDYSDGTCPSLLLEPTATNSILNHTGSSFSAFNGASIVLNDSLSPDGGINSTKVVISGSADELVQESGLVIVSGQSYTISGYFKLKSGTLSSTNNDFKGLDGLTGSGLGFSTFNTINNTWQRLSVTVTSSTASGRVQLKCEDSAEILIWGLQVESNSFATSLVKTAGSAQTRVADTASGSGSSTVINSSEGVLYAEISALANDGTKRYISLSDGSNNNDVRIYFDLNGYISVLSKVAGTSQVFLQSNSYTQTDFNKIAFKYKENDFAFWVNGVEVGTDLSGITNSIGTLNQLSFFGNNLPFYGKTKSVQVYTTALTDAELTTLTTI